MSIWIYRKAIVVQWKKVKCDYVQFIIFWKHIENTHILANTHDLYVFQQCKYPTHTPTHTHTQMHSHKCARTHTHTHIHAHNDTHIIYAHSSICYSSICHYMCGWRYICDSWLPAICSEKHRNDWIARIICSAWMGTSNSLPSDQIKLYQTSKYVIIASFLKDCRSHCSILMRFCSTKAWWYPGSTQQHGSKGLNRFFFPSSCVLKTDGVVFEAV